VLGEKMSVRIDTLVRDMISTSKKKGEISLSDGIYEALMGLRTWLFRNVYRDSGSLENQKAASVVAALFQYYLEHPESGGKDPDPVTETVDFVAGMTDRYALATTGGFSCLGARSSREALWYGLSLPERRAS
jgi:dGTPase